MFIVALHLLASPNLFLQGKNPLAVWTALKSSGDAAELSKFALMVLKLVINQAACERAFSEIKNNESPHRARIGLEKLEKMSKVDTYRSYLFRIPE